MLLSSTNQPNYQTLESIMYRSITITVLVAVAALTSLTADLHAQTVLVPSKFRSKTIADAQASGKTRYLEPDLTIASFTGRIEGNQYVLGWSIRNQSKTDYAGGRLLRLFVHDDYGTTTIQTFTVGPLKANQLWRSPTFRLPLAKVNSKSATVRFDLSLMHRDRDERDEFKSIWVTPVR